MLLELLAVSHQEFFEQKKLERKEYDAVQNFVNDVELICTNAYNFNEENSFVWNDAKALQVS